MSCSYVWIIAEMKDIKAKNRQLYETIDELRNEHVSLKEQVSRLEEELASQYLRYRDEFDARKLLIADVNELRYQNEELLAAKTHTETQDAHKEDPVMLRIALRWVVWHCCSLFSCICTSSVYIWYASWRYRARCLNKSSVLEELRVRRREDPGRDLL